MVQRLLQCAWGLLGLAAIAPPAIATEPALSLSTPFARPGLALTDISSGKQPAPTKLAEPLTQVPFTDVRPDDWAYPALEQLIEVYGCLDGYPDGRFRGDRPLTRYEFAAALNACLDSFIQQVETERQVDLGELVEALLDLREDLGSLSDQVEAMEAAD